MCRQVGTYSVLLLILIRHLIMSITGYCFVTQSDKADKVVDGSQPGTSNMHRRSESVRDPCDTSEDQHVTEYQIFHILDKLRSTATGTDGLASWFLPARRYASAGNSDRNVSVCPSVCPSVRHAPVLCQNEES